MDNKLYLLIIFLIKILFVKNILTQIDSSTTEIILKNDKLIYVNNETDEIYIYDLISNNYSPNRYNNYIKKNKILFDLDNKGLIFIGLATNNSLIYCIYDDIANNGIPSKIGSFQVDFLFPLDYIIKKVSEKIYILSYINNNNYIVAKLELDKESILGRKDISGGLTENKKLNTIECDSFDGEMIFCIFSICEYKNNDEITSIEWYYSFIEVSERYFDKNIIGVTSNNANAASVAKILDNKEKKFIVCFFITKERNGVIYCQFFIQKDNEIHIDNVYLISETTEIFMNRINYEKNIPIKIKIFENSIFLFFDITRNGDEKSSLLYTSSLDLGLNIQEKIEDSQFTKKQNIIINENYRIIYRISNGETKLEYRYLNIICNNNQIYEFNSNNQISGIDITDNIIHISNEFPRAYLSFSVDLLTYLYIENERIMGGLSKEKTLNDIIEIKLQYNKNLILSNNYYIYYNKTVGGNYITISNFCLFKVVNCYETCMECNPEIQGNLENHQCLTCKEDYYRYETSQNQKNYYNCYKKDDPKVLEGVYFDEVDEFYYKCDISCKSCEDNLTCITCNDGYYFKNDSINGNKLNEKCYNNIPAHNYYLDTNSNLNYNNQIINFVYKKCYDTCYSCFGGGDKINNKCLSCIDGYTNNYIFDNSKCTLNSTNCSSYWEIDDDKNVNCINKCNYYVINEGENKNQCVKKCQSYFNPYETNQIEPLLTYSCDTYKLCIKLELCKSKKLEYDNNNCYPPSIGCVDIEEYIPPEQYQEEEVNWEDYNGNIEIKNRLKVIKFYNFDTELSEINDNFIVNIMNIYNTELNKELEIHKGEYLNGIDFITLSRYKDFSVTLYPLRDEEYIFKNLLELNKLSFINCTKLFHDINYKIKNDNDTILIALIEYKTKNLPINTISYFFILYDDINNKLNNIININKDAALIEISYILYNFKNSNIKEKYSTKLISSIKKLYNLNKDIVFYDKNNKFFNDICFTFKSEGNTDITIEDRINEYYTGYNLCEKDCELIKIYNKEENKSPRALCRCKIKDNLNISDDNYSFDLKDSFKKDISNINAIKCGGEVFSKDKINSNPIFWVYIIFLIIEFILIINVICCGKKVIDNMVKTKILGKQKDKEDENNKYQDVKISEHLKSSERANYKNNIKLTSPKKKNGVHPPKRKNNKNDLRKRNKIIIDNGNSNNETSIAENKQISFNNNKSDLFEDIFDSENNMRKNNYLFGEKNFKENNYLVFGYKQTFEKIKTAFKHLDKNELEKNKYLNTDINDDFIPDKKGKFVLSEIECKKNYFSEHDGNYRYIIPNDFSKIKNKYMKKISRFSRLFGIESESDKFLPQDMRNAKNNLIEEDNNLISNRNKTNDKDTNKSLKDNESEKINENININNEINENDSNNSKKNEDEDNNSYNNSKNNDNDNINSDNNKDNFDKISNIENRKQMSYDFRLNNRNKYSNNLISDIKNDSISNKNYSYIAQNKGKNAYKNSKNSELLKKKNKKFGRDLSKSKKVLKNSLNMSINSNNKFLNSKNEHNNNIDEISQNKNSEKYNEIKKSENYNENKNSENEEIIYNKKNILSSVNSEYEKEDSLEIDKNKNCTHIYFNYFIKRELILASFYNKYNNIAHFIRISTFIFAICLIFMVNCLLLTTSDIHDRYIYSKNNNKIEEIKYIFQKEIIKILLCVLFDIILKDLCIKLFLGCNDLNKDYFSHFNESNKNNKEIKESKYKRKKYIKKYWIKSLIVVLIQILFLLILGYISICYIGTFPNTFKGIIARFFISFIFSFLICAFICFVIIIFYKMGCTKFYNFLQKIY